MIATLVTGGAERQVELLAGHTEADASVLAIFSGGPVADSMRAAGIPVTVLGLTGWRRTLAWWMVARHLRAQGADLVHVHLLSGQLWGIPAARLARIPVLSTEHSLMDDSIEGRPLTWWLRLLYLLLERLTVATIAVSERTAERLIAWGVQPARIQVINNGIDVAAQRAAPGSREDVRREFGIPLKATVFIGVGRLDPVKRFDSMLTGLQRQLLGGAHLLLVGDGSARSELLELADRLDVSPVVHLAGARADVPRLLAAADVFVSLSRDETFGIAIVEAVAAGLVVIFAACPALEALEDLPAGVVQLSAADDSTALGTTVQALPLLPASQSTRLGVLAKYDIGHISRQVSALYARILGI